MDHVSEATDDPGLKPTLAGLIGQLAGDTREFARAEVHFLKVQLGERSNHALPGLIAILVALTLAFAALVAVVVVSAIALAAIWGMAVAIIVVTGAVLAISALLLWWGSHRIGRAFKSRDKR